MKTTVTKTIIIELSEEEATFIHDMMQNQLHTETVEEATLRGQIFECLHSALDLDIPF